MMIRTPYPADADGDAIRRVENDGSDMSLPMDIDLSVDVPDEPTAVAVANAASDAGYRASVVFDDEDSSWSVYCTTRMLLTYDGIIAEQAALEAICKPLGGTCDGWGTFGNTPSTEP